MDLFQSKLTKSEWESIEVPVSIEEKKILQLIVEGYNNLNISRNDNYSLLSYLKITYNVNIESYIYENYFHKTITQLCDKYSIKYNEDEKKNKKIIINKPDQLRLNQNNIETINKDIIFEFILLEILSKMLRYYKKDNKRWVYYYYTLFNIIDYSIPNINIHVKNFIKNQLSNYQEKINLPNIILKSGQYIERNEYILKYSNIKLYDHQKKIYSIFKNSYPEKKKESFFESDRSNLVLYIAPTATGKTLTPLGLSEQYKIIFVCAARHVGIALSKSAVSLGKKVAFGFGCSCSEDIRLHYFSASSYVKHNKTGTDIKYKDGKKKIDNTDGSNVEIMICDIQSYKYAMYYMTSFHDKNKIITYWDEPTITMDYDDHPCHKIIQDNWRENIIPNMVLSSATLPKESEILNVIQDFKSRFDEVRVHTIESNDCKKTIPMINTSGYVELPHYIYENYDDILECADHCQNYPTILRYFDLHECSRFIIFVHEKNLTNSSRYELENVFGSLEDIKMITIKEHYLKLLKNIKPECWAEIFNYFQNNREYFLQPNKHFIPSIKKNNSIDAVQTKQGGGNLSRQLSVQETNKSNSIVDESAYTNENQHGIYVTTRDAYSLTSGPTIYLANDTEKIAKFCLKQSNIPTSVMNGVMESIHFNSKISKKIEILDKKIEDLESKDLDSSGKIKENKISKDLQVDGNKKKQDADDIRKLTREINELKDLIKTVNIDSIYIPNKIKHLLKWTGDNDYTDIKPFTSDVIEEDIEEIMQMNVDNIWKILIILGIGLFSQNVPIEYIEKVKTLATQQKLYLIIANEDFIYGTNYQFCHGYISKDLNMTQEKIIQSMGRIGRNKLQHQYSVRIRDNKVFKCIFEKEENKKEVINMNRLLNQN